MCSLSVCTHAFLVAWPRAPEWVCACVPVFGATPPFSVFVLCPLTQTPFGGRLAKPLATQQPPTPAPSPAAHPSGHPEPSPGEAADADPGGWGGAERVRAQLFLRRSRTGRAPWGALFHPADGREAADGIPASPRKPSPKRSGTEARSFAPLTVLGTLFLLNKASCQLLLPSRRWRGSP